jgi:predicted membrane chloride channel (bestrophin family)
MHYKGFEGFRREFAIKATLVSCFQAILGFLLIFRTSQAYARYMTACTLIQQMHGAYFDACSSIVAFVRMSKAELHEADKFKLTIVSLFSALSAFSLRNLVLSELSMTSLDGAAHDPDASAQARATLQGVDILAASELSEETVRILRTTSHRVSLIFHWIQALVVENLNSGLLNIPPPILSRAFNELADGMVKFEDSLKLVWFPYPSPYTQATFFLLCSYSLLTPSQICEFTNQPSMVFVFSFLFLFTFWALYLVAQELECPFDGNGLDLNLHTLQHHMNARLALLVTPAARHSPALCPGAERSTDPIDSSMPVTWLIPDIVASSDSDEAEGFIEPAA